MPTFIPAHGRTPHLAGVCVNRIGTPGRLEEMEVLLLTQHPETLRRQPL